MIYLRLVSQRKDRRTWLESVLNGAPDLQVVCSGNDLDDIVGRSPLGADVIVVDLEHPQAAESRFWSALHLYFAGARMMAMTDTPINPARLEAALQAGACYMLDWCEPVERVQRAARAAGSGAGFVPLSNVLMAMTAYFDACGVTIRQVCIGDAVLDLRRSAFVRGSEVILLTKLEQDLLVYLSDHAGRPASAAALLQAVWHQSPESTHLNEQIKSTIKRLRQKIEPDPARPRYLLNRHGLGYYVPVATPARALSAVMPAVQQTATKPPLNSHVAINAWS